MKRRVGIVIAWVAATVISVLIATAAVGAVRGRVTDAPPAVASPTTTTTTIAGTTSTTVDDGSTTSTSTTSPTFGSSTTATTTSIAPAGTTTSTSDTASTSTSQPTTQPEIATFTMIGGTVAIEVTPTELRLLGATPNSGFTVAETELNQTRIDIEFSSADHESKFRAELKDGVLDTEIDEEGED